jgi:hypothetical protein
VTIPATVPQRSEIPEGLTNYPAYSIYQRKVTSRMSASKSHEITAKLIHSVNVTLLITFC